MKRYTGPNGEPMVNKKLSESSEILPERLAEIEAIPDDEIDTSDIPDLDDDFWKQATVGWNPPRKTHLSLRLDNKVVDYFKQQGRGYQSRINAVLRVYVEKQLEKKAKSTKVK